MLSREQSGKVKKKKKKHSSSFNTEEPPNEFLEDFRLNVNDAGVFTN